MLVKDKIIPNICQYTRWAKVPHKTLYVTYTSEAVGELNAQGTISDSWWCARLSSFQLNIVTPYAHISHKMTLVLVCTYREA